MRQLDALSSVTNLYPYLGTGTILNRDREKNLFWIRSVEFPRAKRVEVPRALPTLSLALKASGGRARPLPRNPDLLGGQ